MSTASGNRLPPARLNPVAFQLQLASAYPLTATATDLTLTTGTTGFTTSYTVPAGGMTGLAVWCGDFQLTTAGTITSCTLELVLDGTAISSLTPAGPQAIWDPGNVTDGRATCFQSWPFTLTAGSHTFGLRASRVAASGTVTLNARHTCVSIWLHP